MAQERSETNSYQSRYGGGWITSAQYIAEVMCERLAKKDKKDLPVKFWNTPTWKRAFLQQVLAANTVLKLFKPQAILAALRREWKAFSLRAAWLTPVFQEEQSKLENQQQAIEEKETVKVEATVVKTDEKPRPTFYQKKSVLNKLRDLDG